MQMLKDLYLDPKIKIHGMTFESSEKKDKTAITHTIISHLQNKFSHFPNILELCMSYVSPLLENSISFEKLCIAQE